MLVHLIVLGLPDSRSFRISDTRNHKLSSCKWHEWMFSLVQTWCKSMPSKLQLCSCVKGCYFEIQGEPFYKLQMGPIDQHREARFLPLLSNLFDLLRRDIRACTPGQLLEQRPLS